MTGDLLEGDYQYHIFFAECLKRIGDKLSSSIVVDENEAIATDSFRHKLEGILSNPKKRRGRTDEAIYADVRNGMIGELGVAKLLGVEVWDSIFDEKDPHSYGKDVIYESVRIEVKTHTHLRHFTIGYGPFSVIAGTTRPAQTFDVLLFVHRERIPDSNSYWTVRPTLIVDPYPEDYNFLSLWNESDYSKVYPAANCAARNLCLPLIDLEA